MIVKPYTIRPTPPQLAILDTDARFLDEHGETWLGRRLPTGIQAWASQETVLNLLRDGWGRALCWRGRPIRYAPSGVEDFRVRVIGEIDTPPAEQALAGLCTWRDWLAEYGAAPSGSLGATSRSLLRATLEADLWTTMPFASSPPMRFTIGGRQEIGPRGAPAEYTGELGLFDMRAAYASTLAGLRYGGHWFKLHAGKVAAHARLAAKREGALVFCRARVNLAGTRPGPLVRRPKTEPVGQLAFYAEYPSEGTIQGVWTLAELDAAEAHGARVRILDGWVHVSDWLPFWPWWLAVQHGRDLGGFAGVLGKATGNALWGQFCIKADAGNRAILYWDRAGRRQYREQPSQSAPRPAHDLAEFLTGTIRSRLYAFCMAAGDRLCSAHTDGGWVDCSAGWGYPGWRLKERAERLRVLNPQGLAYRTPGAEEDSYVMSGLPQAIAAEAFEAEWQEAGRVAA